MWPPGTSMGHRLMTPGCLRFLDTRPGKCTRLPRCGGRQYGREMGTRAGHVSRSICSLVLWAASERMLPARCWALGDRLQAAQMSGPRLDSQADEHRQRGRKRKQTVAGEWQILYLDEVDVFWPRTERAAGAWFSAANGNYQACGHYWPEIRRPSQRGPSAR